MARIKLVYIGGGSTRAPGTVATIVAQGQNFEGSEIVLVDLDPDRLETVEEIGRRMARAQGHDIRFSSTTDRRTALQDCDAVLTSYRPGGLEARVQDERIPLRNGVIGQETQGPGGFFMALRSIHVAREILADVEVVCPHALWVNYTNPINIVSQALTEYSDFPVISLCDGPIIFPRGLARRAGLDPDLLRARMVGLNHACWSLEAEYDGEPLWPLLQDRLDGGAAATDEHARRMLELAATLELIPAEYMQYYYFTDEVLGELRTKPTTRSEDILKELPSYWEHYREQARSDAPELDPARSRGGVNELELAIDVIDAVVNDRGVVLPVNVPNRGAIADFPDDLVVEVPGFVDRHGVVPLTQGHMPHRVLGLLHELAEYQMLAARVGWEGGRREGVQALMSNPLVRSAHKAAAIYDEMAAAHRDFLPARLLE